jgi:hypothetical protein
MRMLRAQSATSCKGESLPRMQILGTFPQQWSRRAMERVEEEKTIREHQEGRVNIPAACPILPFVAAVAVTQAAFAASLAPQLSPNLSHMKLVMMSMSVQAPCQPEFILPA